MTKVDDIKEHLFTYSNLLTIQWHTNKSTIHSGLFNQIVYVEHSNIMPLFTINKFKPGEVKNTLSKISIGVCVCQCFHQTCFEHSSPPCGDIQIISQVLAAADQVAPSLKKNPINSLCLKNAIWVTKKPQANIGSNIMV